MADYPLLKDPELVDLLKSGDHAAYTELFNRYWKKMLLVAWNHTKDKTAAEDIVHQVFINLWERHKATDIREIAAFLTTAVKFSVFKHYQREQRRLQLAIANYTYTDIVLEEEKLDALFLKEYINGIVEEMPEKCKLVFRMSRDEGMKNPEIAQELNITEKAVEANLTRALKTIKGNLKNSGILLLLVPHIWKDLF